MPSIVTSFTQLSVVLAVASQIATVALVLAFFSQRGTPFHFVKSHALRLAFVVALGATLGSMFYSDIAGFEPCSLCWYQRTFMFPLVFLLGMATLRNDRGIIPYARGLAAIGAIIALYHHYIQLGGSPLIPCSAAAVGVSCAQRFIFELGYITIPLMSFTAFALIFAILTIGKEKA